MTSREYDPTDSRHEINLVGVIRASWRHQRIVVGVASAFVLLALVWALTATPIFRAEVTLTEVQDNGVGGGGGLASSLGGLASLAGVNLGMLGENHDRQATLQSRHLVEEFVRRKNLQSVLLHGSKHPQTQWSAVERFRKSVLDITEDKLKGTITVTIDWTDPVTAAQWANEFVALANELLRDRAIAEATRNVEYLKKQVSETNLLGVQQAMYSLIEQQTKTLMLANARQDYAFLVVDPATVPEIRVSPRRTLMVLGGGVLGLFFGTIAAFTYDRWRAVRGQSAVPASAASRP